MTSATTKPRNIGRNANWSCDAWNVGALTLIDMEDGTFSLVRVVDADKDDIREVGNYPTFSAALDEARRLADPTLRGGTVEFVNV